MSAPAPPDVVKHLQPCEEYLGSISGTAVDSKQKAEAVLVVHREYRRQHVLYLVHLDTEPAPATILAALPILPGFEVARTVLNATESTPRAVRLTFRATPDSDQPGTSATFVADPDARVAPFLALLNQARDVAEAAPEEFTSSDAVFDWPVQPQFDAASLPGGDAHASPDGAARGASATDPRASIMGDGLDGVSEEFLEQFIRGQDYEFTPASVHTMKEKWIENQLRARAKEFTKYKPIHLAIGTYNVNGKFPKSETGDVLDLSDWLRFPEESSPDIFVIGFQELDLSAEAFVFNNSTLEDDWARAIEAAFCPSVAYWKLKSKQLVGMLLMVYVRQEILPNIRAEASEAQGTGIMGMMGNKGGVSIRFELYDSSFCFVNSHLAAHDDAVQRRNQDFHEICRRSSFRDVKSTPIGLFDHDHLFWLGDLNYRIPLPDAEVKELAKAGKFEKLRNAEQLQEQRKLGAAFAGFEEALLDFPPSYKYDPGTDDFDSSEKLRTPAWCDRVMFFKDKKQEPLVKQMEYTSCPQVRISDHKPVRARYEVQAKVIKPEAYREVYQSIVRQLDALENKSMPDVQISQQAFVFEGVRYLQPQTESLTIENTGQVVCTWQFVPKLEDTHTAKPFLWIEPSAGVIMPGEKATVTLIVMPDDRSTVGLNNGSETLDDILILHLVNGKDYFITVSGTFLRTCFCTPIEELCLADRAVREIPIGPLKAHPRPSDRVTRLHVPKELWVLVDDLYARGLDEENLFLSSGNRRQIEAIREALDVGEEIDPDTTDIHAVAECLIGFLQALPEPVIPFHLYQRCIDCSNSYILCRQAVAMLSAAHQCVFLYIVSFLQEILRHSEKNSLTPERLAFLFGPILLRPPETAHDSPVKRRRASDASNTKKRAAFLYLFLVDEDS